MRSCLVVLNFYLKRSYYVALAELTSILFRQTPECFVLQEGMPFLASEHGQVNKTFEPHKESTD